jgi:hypothetical protein
MHLSDLTLTRQRVSDERLQHMYQYDGDPAPTGLVSDWCRFRSKQSQEPEDREMRVKSRLLNLRERMASQHERVGFVGESYED